MTSNPPTDGIHLATEFLDRSTPASWVRNILLRYPALSPAIVLLIAVIIFGLLNERFLYPNNLSLIAQQVAIVGTVAAAQTIIILTAGIDLSVGAVWRPYMTQNVVLRGSAAVFEPGDGFGDLFTDSRRERPLPIPSCSMRH